MKGGLLRFVVSHSCAKNAHEWGTQALCEFTVSGCLGSGCFDEFSVLEQDFPFAHVTLESW